MAKALIGHLSSDQRSVATLAAENRRLRTRVADLETLVLRLQAENDRLAAAVREESRAEVEHLQPV
jgi:cell division protein FtsB